MKLKKYYVALTFRSRERITVVPLKGNPVLAKDLQSLLARLSQEMPKLTDGPEIIGTAIEEVG